MKVLHINTSDSFGGAAKAAFRLHRGLMNRGIDSGMLVQDQQSTGHSIHGPGNDVMKILGKFRPYLDRLPLLLYSKSIKMQFHVGWMPDFLQKTILRLNPDVIHLHWICDGFFDLNTLKQLNRPIVWTLHDMWSFTGGCHYSGECLAYREMCGKCPQLESRNKSDLSRWGCRKKQKALHGLSLIRVSPSRWLADCAETSDLFQSKEVSVIPNGIDISIFKPLDRLILRQILNLPLDKKIILFGAVKAAKDHRKGFDLLILALKKMEEKGVLENTAFVFFGDDSHEILKKINMMKFCFGFLHDDISLSMLYGASDIFVNPTREDIFSNTMIESMACGTPCVSFGVGGIPDIIEHKINGYLARASDVDDLAEGIRWVLKDVERGQSLSRNARKTVEEKFDINIVAKQYESLYLSLL